MNGIVFLICLPALINVCKCGRILGIIPTPSYSHQVVFQPLWKELSLRGHQVTVLTTNPMRDQSLTNLTEIDTSSSYGILTEALSEIINNSEDYFKVIDLTTKAFSKAFENQLKHPDVKVLINDPNVQFDLLITEYTLHMPMAFAKKFNCPCIGALSIDGLNSMYSATGNPAHPIAYPNALLGEEGNLTFKQRLYAVLYEIVMDLYDKWIFIPHQEILIEKHFGHYYDLDELFKKVSLLFVNTDPIFHIVRPISPNVIPIGGRPMRLPSKGLPKDLQETLHNAQNGFIYFSLGSNINSGELPQATVNAILSTFKELPYLVLWKYELEDLQEHSDNVIISKWFPQLDVLSHPNIKLFITHGGAQSVEEGIFARVPMLGIPIFSDQPFNIKKLVSRGCSLSVDYKTLEKAHFKGLILEMINNSIYKNRIKELANLAEDQPMTGLERAIWWTEYVLRHNGTLHFRNPIINVPWYRYYFIDVIALAMVSVVVLNYVYIYLLE